MKRKRGLIMGLISYKYNDKTQLTTHYRVSEWKCKCGKNHEIKIHSDLPNLLEQVMTKIGAIRGDISSGYRCSNHDRTVGGTGSDTHGGYACDIRFKDGNGKIIDSKYVALALEDLGHNFGIGYKCGGSSYYTHIDVKPRKWYGDESKSSSKSCCNSFYDYFGIKKPIKVVEKTLTLTTAVFSRIGGIGFLKKRALYGKGTVITDVTMNVGKSSGYTWLKGYVNGNLRYFPYKDKWYK
jgi:hypothetical protein